MYALGQVGMDCNVDSHLLLLLKQTGPPSAILRLIQNPFIPSLLLCTSLSNVHQTQLDHSFCSSGKSDLIAKVLSIQKQQQQQPSHFLQKPGNRITGHKHRDGNEKITTQHFTTFLQITESFKDDHKGHIKQWQHCKYCITLFSYKS